MTTLAEKIVALSSKYRGKPFVSSSEARELGLEFPDHAENFGFVTPFSLAIHSQESGDGNLMPSLHDERGFHYKMADGSWVLFEEMFGVLPLISNGIPRAFIAATYNSTTPEPLLRRMTHEEVVSEARECAERSLFDSIYASLKLFASTLLRGVAMCNTLLVMDSAVLTNKPRSRK